MPDQDTVFASNETSNTAPTTETHQESGLVGEGKKYATTDAALASIVPAQEHIARLETENALFKEQVAKAKTVEDVLARLEDGKPKDTTTSQTETGTLSEQDIRRVIQEDRSTQQATSNILSADKQLKALVGADNAGDVLRNKSHELGMSVDQLQNVAANSPTAFMAFFGPKSDEGTTKTTSTTIPAQAGDTAGAFDKNAPKPGTMKSYDALRVSDPKKYWAKGTQIEMHRRAQEMGAAFFTD